MICGGLLLLLALSPVHAQDQVPSPPPEQIFNLPLFTEGLYTRYSSNMIPDSGLAEALNVLVDEDVDGVVVRRNGRAKYNGTAITNTKTVRGLWAFNANDGTKYLIAVSSAAFYRSAGDGTWTAITGLSGFSSTAEWDCTSALGRLWCLNGYTVFSWDGTSTATITGAPLGTSIDNFRNRIVIAGIVGSKGRARLSGELDGTDWTIPSAPISTSPANISVGGINDGNEIICVMGVYNDVMLFGKQDSLWGLYGFDRDDFALRELSREVGCIEDKSVQEKGGRLYWLSKRGLERMRGGSIDAIPISDPIRDQIDEIIASAPNEITVVDTSQTDFEAGNLTASGPGAAMSATVSLGNLTPSTWTITDTSFPGSFGAQIDTTTTSGRLLLSQISLTNAGFESGNLTYWTASADFTLLSSGCDASGNYGSYAARTNGTFACYTSPTLQVLNGSDDSILRQALLNMVPAASLCSVTSIDITTQTASTVKLRITDGTTTMTSSAFSRPSGAVTVHRRGVGSSSNNICYFDTPNPYYSSMGTYISQEYDTTFSTPTWGLFGATLSSGTNLGDVDFEVQVTSTAGGTYDTLIAPTIGSGLTNAAKQYIRHKITITSPRNFGAPYVDDVTLAAATTGYFISQCRNPGNTATGWGDLACNSVANGGTLSFQVSTGATCNAVTRDTAPWTTQANNTVIGVPTAPFLAYKAIFASTSPVLQDCSMSWVEGSTRPPVASMVYRERYHLAFTSNTASGSANNSILVLNKNDKWTTFDNHNCYSLAAYQRKLYCGSSSDEGFVYRMDIGTDDDGASFTSRIRTKDFDLGLPDFNKSFRMLSLDLEPEPDASDSISIAGAYFVDRTTTSITMGSVDLGEDSGVILAKFPFPMSDNVVGRRVSLQLTGTGLNQPSRIFGGRLRWSALRQE